MASSVLAFVQNFKKSSELFQHVLGSGFLSSWATVKKLKRFISEGQVIEEDS